MNPLVMMIISFVILGLMVTAALVVTDMKAKELQTIDDELNNVAKEKCKTTDFYNANFKRCERLEVRP